MSESKSTIGNILLSGYLHEHEQSSNIEIPKLISTIVSVYCKEYKIQTAGSSSEKTNSIQATNYITSLNATSSESNVFRGYRKDSTVNSQFTPHDLSMSVQKQIDELMSNTNDEIIDIKSGEKHTLILTLNGNVYAFGDNDSGQCGLGETITYVNNPTLIPFDCKIKSIACGKLHSLFINFEGKLLVCGYNYCGQLGLENSSNINYEIKSDNEQALEYMYSSDSGDSYTGFSMNDSDSDSDNHFEFENQMNTVYAPVYNEFFSNNDVRLKQVSAGSFHSLCLTTNGECYTFGHNGFGNLGNGSATEYGEGINKPYKLAVNKIFKSIACGDNHSILLTDANEMVVFGDNQNRQCSMINEEDQIENPYVLSKEKEFGVNENCYIEKIICVNDQTISIVDVYKRI